MTSDERLEADIEKAFQRFLKATETSGMRVAMEEMRDLIAKRSPAQINRMEHEKGLA